MKKLLLLLNCFLLISCTGNKRSACLRLREGVFIAKTKEGDSIKVSREYNRQSELNKRTGVVTPFIIRWTGPCEYELKGTSYMNSFKVDSSVIKMYAEDGSDKPLKVKIVFVGKDYYVYEATKEGFDYLMGDTLWIIK